MSRGSEKVVITVDANSEAAKRFAATLAAGLDQAGNAVEGAGKRGKSAFGDLAREADRLIIGLVGVQSAADLVLKSVRAAMQANTEMRQAGASAVEEIDTRTRRFMNAAGMRPSQMGQAQSMLFKNANIYGLPFATTEEISSQLVSSGFSKEAIVNQDVSNATMAGFVAMNAARPDLDPKMYAKSMAMFMSAYGTPMNAQGVMRTNNMMFSAWQKGNVEPERLEEIAREAGTVKDMSGMSQEQYVATMSMLSKKGGVPEMAISLRNILIDMATAKGDDKRKDILRKMGLKPDQIDMVDETAFEAMTAFKGGLDKLKPADRNVAIADFFGKKAIKAAPHLFGDQGMAEIAEMLASMQDNTFMEALESGATGPAAEFRRQRNRRLQADAGGLGAMQTLAAEERMIERKREFDRGNVSLGDKIVADAIDKNTPELRGNTEATKALIESQEKVANEIRGLREVLQTGQRSPPDQSPGVQPARGRENTPLGRWRAQVRGEPVPQTPLGRWREQVRGGR